MPRASRADAHLLSRVSRDGKVFFDRGEFLGLRGVMGLGEGAIPLLLEGTGHEVVHLPLCSGVLKVSETREGTAPTTPEGDFLLAHLQLVLQTTLGVLEVRALGLHHHQNGVEVLDAARETVDLLDLRAQPVAGDGLAVGHVPPHTDLGVIRKQTHLREVEIRFRHAERLVVTVEVLGERQEDPLALGEETPALRDLPVQPLGSELQWISVKLQVHR